MGNGGLGGEEFERIFTGGAYEKKGYRQIHRVDTISLTSAGDVTGLTRPT